ncbi:hypothetical protein ACU0IO_002143 [Serratia marcescens]
MKLSQRLMRWLPKERLPGRLPPKEWISVTLFLNTSIKMRASLLTSSNHVGLIRISVGSKAFCVGSFFWKKHNKNNAICKLNQLNRLNYIILHML